MFVGTVDDGGKFQAIEGPGEFLDLEHEDDPSN
jgi:hypothetical protein